MGDEGRDSPSPSPHTHTSEIPNRCSEAILGRSSGAEEDGSVIRPEEDISGEKRGRPVRNKHVYRRMPESPLCL